MMIQCNNFESTSFEFIPNEVKKTTINEKLITSIFAQHFSLKSAIVPACLSRSRVNVLSNEFSSSSSTLSASLLSSTLNTETKILFAINAS